LAVYLFVPVFVLTHYSLIRDHVRWFLLSDGYKACIFRLIVNRFSRVTESDIPASRDHVRYPHDLLSIRW